MRNIQKDVQSWRQDIHKYPELGFQENRTAGIISGLFAAFGLDVHDVGDYAVSGVSRVLEPGMVFTVEPGLYFPGPFEGPGVAEDYVGIGIRIEDDLVVTTEGHEVLTAGLPASADEIERLVGGQG